MNFLEQLQAALSNGQQPQYDPNQFMGMPIATPQTIDFQGVQVPVSQGMEAFPGGPGPRRLPAPQGGMPVPAGRPPLTGAVEGGPMVGPVPARPGIGRGQTYEGQTVPPGSGGGIMDDLMQAFQARAGAGAGAPAGGPRPAAGGGGNGAGIPPGGSAAPAGAGGGLPVPAGGTGGPGRAFNAEAPAGWSPQQGTLWDFLKSAWGNAGPLAKGAVAGSGAMALGSLFGGDDPAAQAQAGGGFQMPERQTVPMPELPGAWKSEIQAQVPDIDYDSLPRPDYQSIREQLVALAPEAPEEANWLDKMPAMAKNMIGFGLLLGPVGLLLGAGMGMSENQQISNEKKAEFKEKSRDYMREILGFDIDWAKAERSMALEEMQGQRNQAMENIELERSMQQWGMQDRTWQLETQGKQIANQAASQGGGLNIDRVFDQMLLQNPQAVMGMYNQMTQAEDAPIMQGLGTGQQEQYDKMIKANIIRALMGQQ